MVKITRTPKKIIYRYNESITFTAIVESIPQSLVYEWSIDGMVEDFYTEATFITSFKPAATVNERRKDYKVSVCVGEYTAETIVRVAQNVNVGTANVTQSNEGMDEFGWTDTTPVEFDTTLTADEDIFLQKRFHLTRQVRTLLRRQYGRLQYSNATNRVDMTTTGFPYRKAALVITHPQAFKWNCEEFEAMLAHELKHCEHRKETTYKSSFWKKLMAQGKSIFLPFTETIAYFEYLQNTTVSYKFIRDHHVLLSFRRNYNQAQKLLPFLDETTQTPARAILQNCYDEVLYSELREDMSEGWDYHIKPPG